ncbi:MAG: efflux transporter outer membrane subunit [Burkholderiaceae bacterium]|nr:efflux transporter outer membrane subunit [Burkholderiaceae bacterium]
MKRTKVAARKIPALLGITAMALLAACASAPPEGPAPMTLPSAFVETAPTDGVSEQVRPDWWRAFGDPTLDALEAQVATSNADMARALAQLRRARADADLQRAGAAPQVSANVGTSRAHTSANVVGRALAGRTVDDHVASLGASWEPDLFGRVAAQAAASNSDAEAEGADVASLQLALQADLAKDYLTLRSIDAERVLLASSLADLQELLDVTRWRLADGTASELEVALTQRDLEALQARSIDLDTQRAALRHALATLTGQPAASLPLAPAAGTATLPELAAGIPSDLLRRRPDVAAAAQRVAAANARAGIARLAWFPSLVLSIAGGVESTASSSLLSLPSRAWSLGPQWALPLFDGGQRKAALLGAEADVDAASAAYRGKVIKAINEVEDQLATLSTLRREDIHQAQAVQWSLRAQEVADIRYHTGASAYADLLLARRASLSAQRDELLLKRHQFVATVDLVRALGGGWQAPTPTELTPKARMPR